MKNIRILGIIFAIILFVMVLIILVGMSKPKNNVEQQNRNQNAYPSSILSPTTEVVLNATPTLFITPIIISPTPPQFTGGSVETLPRSIATKNQQENNLKKISPYSQVEFSVIYDYRLAMFVVTLTDPKAQNKLKFEAWKTAEYPLLTDADYFVFK